MPYEWSFGFLWRYERLFVTGIEVTLAFTLGTIFLGLIIGLLIGLGRLSPSKLVNAPLVALIEIFRCTPLLVQIVWCYYALPVILGIQIPAIAAATLVLSLYTGAFYAEIFRGGIVSIEAGQWDAARALGFGPASTVRLVTLPQAFRIIIPPLGNSVNGLLKATSITSVISMEELMRRSQMIMQLKFDVLEVYCVAALYYLALTTLWDLVQRRLERRFGRGHLPVAASA